MQNRHLRCQKSLTQKENARGLSTSAHRHRSFGVSLEGGVVLVKLRRYDVVVLVKWMSTVSQGDRQPEASL